MLSVVILTYSERRLNDFRELLDSIDKQEYPNLEVIIVVEKSRTLSDFALRYDTKYKKRVYFTAEKLGVSRARNVGVSLASGELIAFVDDDALLPPEWSVAMVENFAAHPNAIGVTGKAIPLAESTVLRGFPFSLYWALGCNGDGNQFAHYTHFASGVNMAFRREAFGQHRFELDIMGDSRSRARIHRGLPNDENDFAVRLTTDLQRPILYTPDVVVFHKVNRERTTPVFIARYSFWQGFAEGRYGRNPKWRRARSQSYETAYRNLMLDLSSLREGVKPFVHRIAILTTAIMFVLLGILAWELVPTVSK